MTDWITDRPPTVNDADCYGAVLIQADSPDLGLCRATWRYAAASSRPWRHTSAWRPGDPVAEELVARSGACFVDRRYTSDWCPADPVAEEPKEEAQSSAKCNTATITLGPSKTERYQWILRRAKVIARAISCSLETGEDLFVHDAVLELEELTHQLQEYANHD